MKTQQKAYLALTATSLIWGTTWVAMKLGVKQMPALEMAAIRQFIGASIFIIFFLKLRQKKWKNFSKYGIFQFLDNFSWAWSRLVLLPQEKVPNF